MRVGQFNGTGDIAVLSASAGRSGGSNPLRAAGSSSHIDLLVSLFFFFFFLFTGNKTSFLPKLTSQLPRPTARAALTDRESFILKVWTVLQRLWRCSGRCGTGAEGTARSH